MPSIEQWITKYEQKAEQLIPLPGFHLFFNPLKGFFYWNVWQDVFEIDHTCTADGKWAEDMCMQIAKATGCRLLRTATHRNPIAYERLFKGKRNYALSGIRPNGRYYYVFEKGVI